MKLGDTFETYLLGEGTTRKVIYCTGHGTKTAIFYLMPYLNNLDKRIGLIHNALTTRMLLLEKIIFEK